MGLDMELEFDKYCSVGRSPKTVLPSPRCHSKVEKINNKEKPTCTNELLSLEEDFTEINFHCYHSSSCKNFQSRAPGLEGNEVLRRGSVYQSSREVSKIKKSGAVEGRRKIELSRSGAITFSLGIDSLCSSDEDRSLMERKRSSVMSLNSELSTTSAPIDNIEQCSQEFLDLSLHHGTFNLVSSDGLSEIAGNSNSREHHSSENVETEKIEDPKFRCDPTVSPINDCNGLQDKVTALSLHKSLSAKLAMPYSPSQSENDSSRHSSPRGRFSPIRKMFDPFTKSKSQRSPLGSASSSSGGLPPTWRASIKRNNALRKSLSNDFSNMSQSPEFGSQYVKSDLCNSAVSCSPCHLNGCLKLENKHGAPFFEFSLKFPEDVFVARTWKAGDALNWVYTFHCFRNRRKSNASGWRLKDWNKDCSMVGQMQVSCYLCTELKDAAFDNSMVMEFVLYDVAHARQRVSAQGNPNQSPGINGPSKVSNQRSVGGTCELDDEPDQLKLKLQTKHVTNNGHFDMLSPHPWAPTDLHPSLEIAAIVIQVPFEKRESLKYKGEDTKSDQPDPNLLDHSAAEQRKEGIPDCSSPIKIHVVTPSGNHSLPSTESCGPSPLLDRWRLGGGCDCGGWEIACPLTIFGNPNIQSAEDHPLIDIQQPLELFVQGAKENTPAVTMAVIEEGRYSVDFHAQLSTLQAFSICVAILHHTEASIAVRQERQKQLLQSNSLAVLIEDEVKNLIVAVTEEEKRKASKKKEQIPPSFKLDPPFSPIARV